MDLKFSISRGVLSVRSGSVAYDIKASSGRGACKNAPSHDCQMLHYEGPIPAGLYYLNSSDLDDPSLLGDIGRRLTGDWRIRIKPSAGTHTHGRTNFFIHGGSIQGSAGCIDIGGGLLGNSVTDKLKNDIKACGGTIRLEVVN